MQYVEFCFPVVGEGHVWKTATTNMYASLHVGARIFCVPDTTTCEEGVEKGRCVLEHVFGVVLSLLALLAHDEDVKM